jgi:1-deoxy-D-xylulose-5-phosphate synthase
VQSAAEAVERLTRNGVEVGLVDTRFVKPLDTDLLAQHAARYRHIVTVEEHQRAGGFGSAVLEALQSMPNATARVRVLGVPDRFIEHKSTREEQLADVGLDADGIERTLRNLLQLTPV